MGTNATPKRRPPREVAHTLFSTTTSTVLFSTNLEREREREREKERE